MPVPGNLAQTMRPAATADDHPFIPNLCRSAAVLRITLASTAMAILFTLIRSGPGQFDWDYLAWTALYMLWVSLTTAGLLCLGRRRLSRTGASSQAIIAVTVLTLVTALYAIPGALIFAESRSSADAGSSFAVDADTFWFVLYCCLVSMLLGSATLRHLYLLFSAERQRQSELEARLQALQARIQPHFLFNSLNSIASLIHDNPGRAEETLLDLAELFRSALRHHSEPVPLRDELSLCKRYLAIETLRLGERLQVRFDIAEDTLEIRVPPLSIQPLVENAVYHGIQPLPQGGQLSLLASRKGDQLRIEVSNPVGDAGTGQNPSAGVSRRPGSGRHNRLALENIRGRLEALYGARASLGAGRQGQLYRVEMHIPCGSGAAARRSGADDLPFGSSDRPAIMTDHHSG